MLAFSSMVKELVRLCPAIETGDVFFVCLNMEQPKNNKFSELEHW